ncbi:hypothetical protein BUALT_Bualt01G0125800 [Buddleja alternifolia]|uniref:Uncharacterized protein n=1 Tax=Buddleja alternifolia TaxID=168488 RepID=A0AAV6YAQ6_9LAMI|nr:hypothetical protein BUALT_Bualt01G0125800 [Buddleja alternifolia]
MFVGSVLQYYYYEFSTCVKQFVEAGRLPRRTDVFFLQERAGLDNAPELREEAPVYILAASSEVDVQPSS